MPSPQCPPSWYVRRAPTAASESGTSQYTPCCGVVWCGVVWCGVVWCGVVWCGVVWCGVVWCGVVWCGVVWCGVVWCGVVWCGVVLRCVVWCGVVWCGVVWCGVVWCGVVWCGVVWCGVVWCGVVWCGVVWCGVVWCGVVWCGVVWCGVVWCGATKALLPQRQWPGWSCTRENASWEGCVSKCTLCVVCCAPVQLGICHPPTTAPALSRPGIPCRSVCWCISQRPRLCASGPCAGLDEAISASGVCQPHSLRLHPHLPDELHPHVLRPCQPHVRRPYGRCCDGS